MNYRFDNSHNIRSPSETDGTLDWHTVQCKWHAAKAGVKQDWRSRRIPNSTSLQWQRLCKW